MNLAQKVGGSLLLLFGNRDSAPVFTVNPSLDGDAIVGSTLTVSLGTATGADSYAGSLRHVSDDTEVDTFTEDGTYEIADTDFGEQLYLHVTATGPGGETVTAGEATGAVWLSDFALDLDVSNASTRFQDSAGTTLATTDGHVLGRITDTSGNGVHATETTTANKPLLKLGANGINGIAAALFDGSNDMWTLADNNALDFGTGDFWFVFVSKTNGNDRLYQKRAGVVIKQLVINTGLNLSDGGTTVVASYTGNTNANILHFIRDAAATTLYIYRNGTLVASQTGANVDVTNAAPATIAQGSSFGLMTGLIGQVLARGTKPSTALRQAVDAYLGAKWGITINP